MRNLITGLAFGIAAATLSHDFESGVQHGGLEYITPSDMTDLVTLDGTIDLNKFDYAESVYTPATADGRIQRYLASIGCDRTVTVEVVDVFENEYIDAANSDTHDGEFIAGFARPGEVHVDADFYPKHKDADALAAFNAGIGSVERHEAEHSCAIARTVDPSRIVDHENLMFLESIEGFGLRFQPFYGESGLIADFEEGYADYRTRETSGSGNPTYAHLARGIEALMSKNDITNDELFLAHKESRVLELIAEDLGIPEADLTFNDILLFRLGFLLSQTTTPTGIYDTGQLYG